MKIARRHNTETRIYMFVGNIHYLHPLPTPINSILSLWGAPCCVILYVYLSNIPAEQLRIFCCYFYYVRSQHVSAPTGHPQVKYINIIHII
jgi:hypothetical protein